MEIGKETETAERGGILWELLKYGDYSDFLEFRVLGCFGVFLGVLTIWGNVGGCGK